VQSVPGASGYLASTLVALPAKAGVQLASVANQSGAYVLPTIHLAKRKNKDLLFFASPWSPPAWMKTNGKLGTGRLRKDCYPV
ncbi:MAG: hypothetical protein ACOVT5_08825, partial [Armatimonadaceae bacterium]